MKDYERHDNETEQAVQMVLSNVISEDPRFMERKAPPLSEEFPPGSKVFFLGDHAYGVAAQVSSTTDTTLQVLLAVSVDFSYPPLFRVLTSLPVFLLGALRSVLKNPTLLRCR